MTIIYILYYILTVYMLLLLIKKLSKSRVSSWHLVAKWQCVLVRSIKSSIYRLLSCDL